MLEIKGIGEKKYEQYGEEFLAIIQDWRAEHPDVKQKIRIGDTSSAKPKEKKTADDRPSHLISYQMFQSGKSLKDIATILGYSKMTIENHIFKAVQDGYPLAWGIFFNNQE